MILDFIIKRYRSMCRLLRFVKGLYVLCLTKLTSDVILLVYQRFPLQEILNLAYLRSRLLQRTFRFRLSPSLPNFRRQQLEETCIRRKLVIPTQQQVTLQTNAAKEESLVIEVCRYNASLSAKIKGNVLLIAAPGMDCETFLTGQPRGSTFTEILIQQGFRVFITQLAMVQLKNVNVAIPELDQLHVAKQLEARLEDFHRRCISSHTPLVVIGFSSACAILRSCLDRLPSHNTLHLAMIIEVAPNNPPAAICNGISLFQTSKLVLGLPLMLWMMRFGISYLSQQSLKQLLQPRLYSRIIHWLSSQLLDDHDKVLQEEEAWEEFSQHIDVVQLLGFQYQQHLLNRRQQQQPPSSPWYRHILTTYPNNANSDLEIWERPWGALLSPAANEVVYQPILEQLLLLCEYSR